MVMYNFRITTRRQLVCTFLISAFIALLTSNSFAQTSSPGDYRIEGMTLAVQKMDSMRTFYENVFQVEFEEKTINHYTLYVGVWLGLELLLCPAELARNTANQNRHQFEIMVRDIRKTVALVLKNGGTLMNEIQEDSTTYRVGIYDPDGNSILFRQLKR